MKELIKSKFTLKSDSSSEKEYLEYISNLIQHEKVRLMKNFIQHSDISCLEHSLYVSYISFLICRKMGLDYRSAARGALLHDFFLYDWHTDKPYKGLHGFIHPNIALQNANKYFDLNSKEQDIIQNHMWPLTLKLPRSREAFVVLLVDKYCSSIEILRFGKRTTIHRLIKILEL